jgi:hypothetical protein
VRFTGAMTDPPVPRRPRGLVVAGVVTMIVSVLITFVGIGGVVDSSIDAVDAPRIQAPGQRTLSLEPGRYAVYSPRPEPGQATTGAVRIDDITVTAPDGAEVAVETIDSKLVVSDGELKWAAVGQFLAESAGDHTVAIAPPADSTVLVAPTIAEVGDRSVGWVLLSGLGFAGFILGVVIMFTGVARRAGDTGPGPDAPFGRGSRPIDADD